MWQEVKSTMRPSGDIPLFLFLTKYVFGRNVTETDEAGEITRLNGYHEEVLLLFKINQI